MNNAQLKGLRDLHKAVTMNETETATETETAVNVKRYQGLLATMTRKIDEAENESLRLAKIPWTSTPEAKANYVAIRAKLTTLRDARRFIVHAKELTTDPTSLPLAHRRTVG